LTQWLELVGTDPDDRDVLVADHKFPTDALRDEYVASVGERSDLEVKVFLRSFLIVGGSFGVDRAMFQHWMATDKIAEMARRFEFVRRMIGGRDTWEGNTWILDLLPDHPQLAIDAINAYTTAHLPFMPEGKMDGAEDAIDVIQAKYLAARHPREVLTRLSARDFEMLVADLYQRMGYSTALTRNSADGGYDVVATRTTPGRSERVLIECKRYEQAVGVQLVRHLWGVVDRSHATRGVLVTTSSFTRPAILFAGSGQRIELLDYDGLNRLLNAWLGSEWPSHIAHRIAWAWREREGRDPGHSGTI
jgi:restriction system protein